MTPNKLGKAEATKKLNLGRAAWAWPSRLKTTVLKAKSGQRQKTKEAKTH